MLKGSTKFGAELDSLSDFVSFGVAPAILLYQWSLFDLPKFGWFFCLLMSIGMAMRLARFNTMLDEEPQPEYWNHFFVGVPAPAAAALAMMPVMISFDFPEYTVVRSHAFVQHCCASFPFDGQQNTDFFYEEVEGTDLYVYADDADCGFVRQLYHHPAVVYAGNYDCFVCGVHSFRGLGVLA